MSISRASPTVANGRSDGSGPTSRRVEETTPMSATLSDKIVQAIQTGTPPLISIAELLAAATSSDPVVSVVVSFSEPLALTSLYRLAALTPGVPLGQWLPNEGAIAPIFGDGVAALERVGFTLSVADKKL